ncbi:MAG: ROK family protein [Phycisphaerales bacterium]
MADGAPLIGIDLGGTNIQVGVVRPGAELVKDVVVGGAKKKTKADQGLDAILDRLVDGVNAACQDAGVALADIAAVGIGAPGVIDQNEGVVVEAVNLRWNDVPLARLLGDRLAKPVVVDNDVNVALWGERAMGSAAGHEDVLGIWMGTGVGGALILGGRLYEGHWKSAGEIGHMVILPGNPPGSRTFEQNCSRTAVVDAMVRLIRSNRKSVLTDLCGGQFSKAKSRTLGRALEMEDPLTVEVVEHTAELVGIVAANIVTMLSLPLVVLGGGLTESLGQRFVDLVQQGLREHAFPARCREARVVASALEDHAGVIGAAMVAAERVRVA